MTSGWNSMTQLLKITSSPILKRSVLVTNLKLVTRLVSVGLEAAATESRVTCFSMSAESKNQSAL